MVKTFVPVQEVDAMVDATSGEGTLIAGLMPCRAGDPEAVPPANELAAEEAASVAPVAVAAWLRLMLADNSPLLSEMKHTLV